MLRSLCAALSVAAATHAGAQTIFYDDIPGANVVIDSETRIGDPPFSASEMIRFFDVRDEGVVKDVNIGLRLSHQARGDLQVFLRHPDGTVIRLLNGVPSDLNLNLDVLLDDASSNPISDGTSDNTALPWYDRTAKPRDPLSTFNGKPAKGIWLIGISDVSPLDFDGIYRSAQLQITFGAEQPDLELSRLECADPFGRLGRPAPFTATIENVGETAAKDATFSLPIPANSIFQAGSLVASAGSATYNADTQTILWSGPIASAQAVTVNFGIIPTIATGSVNLAATVGAPGALGAAPTYSVSVIDPLNGGVTDSFGYQAKDSYNIGGPTFAWIEASDGTALNYTDDDGHVNITAPFPITFYGVSSTTLRVSNNGGIIFNRTDGALGFFNDFTLASESRPIIAPLWDDLGIDSGAVHTKTVGTAPNRRFVVQWVRPHFVNTELPDTVGTAAFQVVFHEGSDLLLFNYLDMDFDSALHDWGLDANVGITSGAGSGSGQSIQYLLNQARLLNGMSIRFTTTPPPIAERWEF